MSSRWSGLSVEPSKPLNALPTADYSSIVLSASQPEPVRAGLVEERVNSIDPSYYDCIYRLANRANVIVDQCHKSLGCCESGCCSNTSWNVKYGFAVALIVLFCLLVIGGVIFTLSCWLINRAKDKKLRKELNERQEIEFSSAPTPFYGISNPPAGNNLPPIY
ncbi:unnamed protein product [Auanema sp. JU1783]|nr:unnamed protein product [Auanema sp. JU1783]